MSRSPSIAFFDMDETLIGCNSARIYARRQWREGRLHWTQLVRAGWLLLRYRFTDIDMASISSRMIRDLAGEPEAEMIASCARIFAEEVRPTIFPGALEAIERHREVGDKVVIISASSPYMVGPLAEHLNLDGYLCTRPLVSEGLFTGEIESPVCYGEGKVSWAERWASERGVALASCVFYTDSHSDIPLLERVGEPHAVNPDPRLRAVAIRRSWPIHHFRVAASSS